MHHMIQKARASDNPIDGDADFTPTQLGLTASSILQGGARGCGQVRERRLAEPAPAL
jgi:hypothetical protein